MTPQFSFLQGYYNPLCELCLLSPGLLYDFMFRKNAFQELFCLVCLRTECEKNKQISECQHSQWNQKECITPHRRKIPQRDQCHCKQWKTPNRPKHNFNGLQGYVNIEHGPARCGAEPAVKHRAARPTVANYFLDLKSLERNRAFVFFSCGQTINRCLRVCDLAGNQRAGFFH